MISVDLSRLSLQEDDEVRERISRITDELFDGVNGEKDRMAGWVDWPELVDRTLVDEICAMAESFRNICSLFIVCGIGGSYLGAKAVIDIIGQKEDCPEVVFAGNSLCGEYHESVLRKMRHNTTCLCCISKSGGTLEPTVAYHVIKKEMEKVYGADELKKRICVITGPQRSQLRIEAEEKQFRILEVPEGVGGRYSVLTPVGLLPIAVAGIDIVELINGAVALSSRRYWKIDGYRYAMARYFLMQTKMIEIFEYFSPRMVHFGEWLKQLCGESEGKEGKGIFPVSLLFSTDLHSMGQYLQEGRQVFFETVIDVEQWPDDILIPYYEGGEAGGMTMNQVNHCVCESMIRAHSKADIPIIVLNVPQADEYHVGQLIYFFEMTVAITGRLMGVDPFNQPGVEKYKQELKALLNSRHQ